MFTREDNDLSRNIYQEMLYKKQNVLDWLKPIFNGMELQKNSLIINVTYSTKDIKERFLDLEEIDEFSPKEFVNFISSNKYLSIELLFYNFLVYGIDEDPEDYSDLFEKSIEPTYPEISTDNKIIQFIFVLTKEKSIRIRDFIKENYRSYKVAKLKKDTFEEFLLDLLDQIENDFDDFVLSDYHESIIGGYIERKLEEDKSEFIDW